MLTQAEADQLKADIAAILNAVNAQINALIDALTEGAPPDPPTASLTGPASVEVNQPYTLTYATLNADTAELDDVELPDLNGTIQRFAPSTPQTVTHDLLAIRGSLTASDLHQIEVTPAPLPPANGGDALINASFSVSAVNKGESVTLNYSITNCVQAWLETNQGVITIDPVSGNVVLGPLHYTQSFDLFATDPAGGTCKSPLNIIVKRPDLGAIDYNGPVTKTAAQSGVWNNPAVWGGTLPNENDICLIPAGLTIDGSGRGDTCGQLNLGGRLNVHDVVFGPVTTIKPIGSSWQLDMTPDGGEKALVILQNRPKHASDTLDTWRGAGFFGGGKVTSRGRKPTLEARSPVPLLAGAMYVDLKEPPVDWRVGDKIVIPMTFPSDSASKGCPEWSDDVCVIRKIEGVRVYFEKPLTYAHPGPYDPVTNTTEDGPPVCHLMRDCGFITTDPTDIATRGHVDFKQCYVDVESCMFHGTGRTFYKSNAAGDYDYEFFKAPVSGYLDRGRHPVAIRNCTGPTRTVVINGETLPSSGPRLDHCVSLDTFPLVDRSSVIWGIAAIDNTDLSLTNCLSFNWYGCGIFVENRNHALVGNSEVRNPVAIRIPGNKGRGDQNPGPLGGTINGIASTGIWTRTPVAFTGGLTATTIKYGIETSGYGHLVSAPPREWGDHELIGGFESFVQFAVSADYPQSHPSPATGVWGKCHAWNPKSRAVFCYPCKNVPFEDWIVRGVPPAWRINVSVGFYMHDYLWEYGDLINCDVRGMITGVAFPVMVGDGQDDPAVRPTNIFGGIYSNDVDFAVVSAYSTTAVAVRPVREFTIAPDAMPTNPRRVKEIECKKGSAGAPNWAPQAPTHVTYVRPADGLTYRVFTAEQATDPLVWGEPALPGSAAAAWATGLVKAVP